MNENLKRMGMSLGLVYVSKACIDTENATHVLAIRMLYVTVQLLLAGILFYLYIQAGNNQDNAVVKCREERGMLDDPKEEKPMEKITVAEYDQRQVVKQAKQNIMGLVITGLVHYKWGYIPPLVLQAVLTPYQLSNVPLIRIYFKKERAVGELRRPWKQNDAFSQQERMVKAMDSIADTWESATSGKPVARKSKKEKKGKKKHR